MADQDIGRRQNDSINLIAISMSTRFTHATQPSFVNLKPDNPNGYNRVSLDLENQRPPAELRSRKSATTSKAGDMRRAHRRGRGHTLLVVADLLNS